MAARNYCTVRSTLLSGFGGSPCMAHAQDQFYSRLKHMEEGRVTLQSKSSLFSSSHAFSYFEC